MRIGLRATMFLGVVVCGIVADRLERAHANLHDCGKPVVDSDVVTTSDALFVLAASTGTETCPLCECDLDNSGGVFSSDALIALNASVGNPVLLICPACSGGASCGGLPGYNATPDTPDESRPTSGPTKFCALSCNQTSIKSRLQASCGSGTGRFTFNCTSTDSRFPRTSGIRRS